MAALDPPKGRINQPLLETVGLEKWFAGLRAVHQVNFRLAPEEIRAIIGPNGAGKTTFVSMICGRIPPTSGRVLFQGKDITHLPAHDRVGLGIAYTFQMVSIFPNLSVREHLALAARRAPRLLDAIMLHPVTLDPEIEAILGEVGLDADHEQPAGSLPHGHQRLLETAMALALQPKLLILDEPTQGLAPAEASQLASVIRRIAGGVSILLIEHNVDVVMRVSQRITVMNEGEVIAEGAPHEIEANPDVHRVYLGQ